MYSGFLSAAASISEADASEAMRWCGSTTREDAEIISSSLRNSSNALSKLQQERQMRSIGTGSAALDACLGGEGIREGEVTEISGGPATAKTQLCLQLCLNAVQLQQRHWQSQHMRAAMYIDAEGGFMSERAMEMAEDIALPACSAQEMLQQIWLYRVHSAEELRGVVELLEHSIRSLNAGIVVIDSIAFHMRHGVSQNERQRVLQAIMHALIKLAHEYKVAIVVVNQAVVRPNAAGYEPGTAAALGESFAHMCSTRLVLGFDSFDRCAWLVKSPKHPHSSATFAVAHAGIRDLRKRQCPDTATTDMDEQERQQNAARGETSAADAEQQLGTSNDVTHDTHVVQDSQED